MMEYACVRSSEVRVLCLRRCVMLVKKSGKRLGSKTQAKKEASKITKGREFALLLSLIQAKACEMTVQVTGFFICYEGGGLFRI